VEAIGHVRHKHLVRLLGYCVEGVHRYSFGHLFSITALALGFPRVVLIILSLIQTEPFLYVLMNVLSDYYSGCWCTNM
jgi:hypothetical protein